jgi:methionine-R-sulfoxide reductase
MYNLSMPYNNLTPEESSIIESKNTEPPFSGEYDDFYEDGTFICRRCNSPLFSSESKFNANCGWPAFDLEFPNSVKRILDKDGRRTEIVCSHCHAHLGHVFLNEGFTSKNTRHCVNSLSLKFVPKSEKLPKVLNQNE